jgi:hypothetical protein
LAKAETSQELSPFVKAVLNQAASVLGMLLVLSFALSVATGLGFAAYFLSKPGSMTEAFRRAQLDKVSGYS